VLTRRSLLWVPVAIPFMRLSARANDLKSTGGDMTVALQSAIDKAGDTGDVAQLGPGTFLTGPLKLKSNVTLQGIPGRTILKSIGASDILSLAAAKRTTIFGIGFATKGVKGTQLTAGNVEQLVVEDCDFAGGEAGLKLSGCGGRISNNRIRFQQKAGLQALGSTGLAITGNSVSDIGNNGIQVWGDGEASNPTIVSQNIISRIASEDGGSGQNGNGINIFRSNGANVSNNHISDCAFTAIRNNASDSSIITGNTVARCNEVAMFVEFEFYGAVVANNIIDTASHGIAITNFLEGGRVAQCTGNVLRNLKGFNAEGVPIGGGIAAEAETVVANNVIENADHYGISLGWGPYGRNLVATGNILTKCRDGIRFSAIAPGPYVIANNIIAGSTGAAIIGMDHDKRVTSDITAASAKVPDIVQLSGNAIRN
jgi:uncharacterized secreted repeat protein (TIGR03808 family)